MCYHKNSPGSLDTLIDRFGRLPVHTRQWVRHVITVPSQDNYAYNAGGNIAFFGTTMGNLNVHVHESAHSLDLLGAYKDKPLSSSQKWTNAYNQDSAVPDPYSQTNQVENVAQNTVVDTFDRNVPGGFKKIQPQSQKIQHQQGTINGEQKEAGNLLVKGGKCTRRLKISGAVRVGGGGGATSANLASTEKEEVPDAEALPAGVEQIQDVDFNTKDACTQKYSE